MKKQKQTPAADQEAVQIPADVLKQIENHGAPLLEDRGKEVPNYNLLAVVYAERAGLAYHCTAGYFCKVITPNVPVPREIVLKGISEFIMTIGKQLEWDRPQRFCGEVHCKRVLGAMKFVAAQVFPDDLASLREFLKSCVERDASSNLTCIEISGEFSLWASERNIPAVPETTFSRVLPEVVRQVFRITKSHHLVRNGGYRRGFAGLKFRKQEDHTAQPPQSSADATDGLNDVVTKPEAPAASILKKHQNGKLSTEALRS
jgi:hypothetical protein